MPFATLGKLRYALQRFRGSISTRLNLEEIDRYWRYQRSGDPYLSAYQHARQLSGSTDDLAKQLRFHTLMQAVEHVLKRQVAGDIVECGCWRGHSARMIADRLLEHGWQGRFDIFDSFEGGLSDKTAEDRQLLGDTDPETTLMQKRLFASARDAVAELLANCPSVSLHQGWIPDVFTQVPDLAERHYALVHIDVDLYQPTIATLRQFGPRMAAGGIIVVDDYGSSHFPGASQAVNEYVAEHPPQIAIEGHAGGILLHY
jgi:O-methyltransferase